MKRAKAWLGFAGIVGLLAFARADAENIDCASTPFGKNVPVLQVQQPLYFVSGSGGKTIEEYRSSDPAAGETPPLTSVYSDPLIQGALGPNLVFRKAVAADLNGDGQDEIVAAYDDPGANHDLVLGVFQRTPGLHPGATLVQTLTYPEASSGGASLDMVAGDFDGSTDGKQEIAVSWTIAGGPNHFHPHVIVLTADGNGRLQTPTGSNSGSWIRPDTVDHGVTGGSFPRLLKGDFLVDGREQLMLVSYGTSDRLSYDLLEYQSPNPALQPLTGQMGVRHFENVIGSRFAVDDSSNSYDVTGLYGLDAAAGNVTDGAGDEIVTALMFSSTFGPWYNSYLAQRLVHLDTTRDSGNLITNVQLGNGSTGYDSSRIFEQYTFVAPNTPLPAFALTIADLDGFPPAEILTARAGYQPTDTLTTGLIWAANRAYVRAKAGLAYRNLGTEGTTSGTYNVAFTNLSHGDRLTYHWDFHDGTFSTETTPAHAFQPGPRSVTLTVTDAGGRNDATTVSFNVTNSADPDATGSAPPYVYAIDATLAADGLDIRTWTATNRWASSALPTIAVADIDHDGVPDVLTFARDASGALNRHVWKRPGDGSVEYSKAITWNIDNGVDTMQVLAADFNGGSMRAKLGSHCMHVTDAEVSIVIWIPPYFEALQGPQLPVQSKKEASFATSSSTTDSEESRVGTDLSWSFNFSVGPHWAAPPIPFVGSLVEETMKFGAGGNFDRHWGNIHGTEDEFEIETGGSAADGEAFVRTREVPSNCYLYDVYRTGALEPEDRMRMCDPTPFSPIKNDTTAANWNSGTETTSQSLNWVPLQREWASLSLFRPVSATTSAAFDSPAANATDGRYDTVARTSAASLNPYIEVDLGSVREISSIRVFPEQPPNEKSKVQLLWGFRLYASQTPFDGPGIPVGQDEFHQQVGAIQDTVSDTWNVNTRDPSTDEPLRARYIRLQYPGTAVLDVAELQVFGDTHVEPPVYPEAICDPDTSDGLFLAEVWNPVANVYQNIDIHGTLMWTGAADQDGASIFHSGVTVNGAECVNDTGAPSLPLALHAPVQQWEIWKDRVIGDSDEEDWDLSSSHSTTSGSFYDVANGGHFGMESETGLGPDELRVLIGASRDFEGSRTTDSASTTRLGSQHQVGGKIGKFIVPTAGAADGCRYFPRPYGYKTTQIANSGFKQGMYVVDYAVRQLPHNGVTGIWQRDHALPAICGGDDNDVIFANGFDPTTP